MIFKQNNFQKPIKLIISTLKIVFNDVTNTIQRPSKEKCKNNKNFFKNKAFQRNLTVT